MLSNNSLADKCTCGHDHEGHHDKLRRLHPDTDWETCVAYSEELDLGTRDYELIRL